MSIRSHLAADGDVTVVTTTASMLGDIDDELRESYRTGGEELLTALKTHGEGAASAADHG